MIGGMVYQYENEKHCKSFLQIERGLKLSILYSIQLIVNLFVWCY